MSSQIIDISTFQASEDDKFIFDCNVLMYVFYTFGDYNVDVMDSYKTLFNDVATRNKCICFPAVLISEFSNTFIRNEYRRYLHENSLNQYSCKFKQSYRTTIEYKETVAEVSDIVNNQLLSLPSAIVCNDQFASMNIRSLYDNENQFDFNDRYYGELSRLNNYYIVTNDKDFEFIDGIKIITSCRALLDK